MTKNTITKMAAIAALIFGFGFASWAEQVTIGNLESASQNSFLPWSGTYDYSYTEEIGGAGAINSLTVYDGTETNEYVPVYGYWADAYQKCEFVIPADQLTDMNGGSLSQMTFYLSSPASQPWTGTFQVFLKEVDNTTLSAFTGTDGATIVYEGTLDGTQSTMTVDFANNYTYSGGNLLVGVYETEKGNYKDAYFFGQNVEGACVQGHNTSSLNAVTATQRNFIPKTTFIYTPTPGLNTLTVYDGTETNEYVPVYGYWADAYQKCEFVIPANQLADMNGGSLSRMTFYLSSPASEPWTGTFQVFLKEVDNTTLDNFTGTDGATVVYEGTLDGSHSTMSVDFANNYTYGGGNLLVGVYETEKGNYKDAYFFGQNVANACVQGHNTSSLNAVTATQRNFIPKTTFTYTPAPGLNSLTVYDGTETNEYVPVYGVWADAYQKCEFIIPANQLADMSGGSLSQMTFYLSYPAADPWTGTFQVFLKEVDNTTLSAFTGTDGATVVYEGTLDGSQSTMTVEFDNNYTYSGGNLLVGVYETVRGNYREAYFFGQNVEGACVQGHNTSSLNAVTATQRNFIPKTTFAYTPGTPPPPVFDTLTVYDGTETNNRVPAYVYFFDDFTRSQFVIPAADLTDMDGGTINGLKFYTNGVNMPYTTVSTVDVYLKEVDYTTLSAYEPKESATIVYQGLLDFELTNDGGELTINFNDDYAYNGGNLLVGIENLTDAGYKNIIFYGQTVTGASGADSHFSSLEQVSFTQQDFIPKTTFAYTPGTPPPPPDPCLIAVTPNAPYIEDFESPQGTYINSPGPLPDCWDGYNIWGETNLVNPHNTYNSCSQGQQSLVFYYHGDSYAILPKFSTAINLLKISFWKQYGNGLQLGYITAADNGTCNTFTAIETYYIDEWGVWTQHVTYLSDVPETAHRLVFKWIGGSGECYIDYVEVTFFDGCYNVGTLSTSELTAHSVHLSWDLIDDSQTEWNVQVATNADFTENLVEYLADSHEDYLLNNLDGGTVYYVRVGPTCSEYWWSNTVVFATQCDGPVTVTADAPYTQGFEDGVIPGCWDVYPTTGNNAPYIYNVPWPHPPHSGYYVLNMYYGSINQYAILPEFDIDLNQLQISFWMTGGGTQLQLGYITAEDDGTCNTFTAIADFEAASTWTHHTAYLLNVPATAHRLAFKTDEDASYCIDDVEVAVIPLGFCYPVGNLGLGRVASNAVYLSWEVYDAEQTAWDVQVATDANFTENVANHVADSHENYLVEGLDPDTYYYVRVKPTCSDDLWSSTVQFWTMPPCNGPITVTADAPYTEDFESPEGTHENELGRLPACWESYTTGSVGPHNTTAGSSWVHGGSQCLSFITENETYTSYAILPEFSNSFNELQISFWLRCNGQLQLGYLTAEDEGNCNTFTTIADFGAASTWTQHFFYLLNVPDTAHRLAIKTNENYLFCFIDDVEVSLGLDCYSVGNLSVGEVSSTSAYLSWELIDNSQTAWNVQLATDEDFTDIVAEYEADTHENYLMEGLGIATQYYVRVKPTCSDDLWNTIDFTTLCGPYGITLATPYTQGFESPEGTAYNVAGPLPPCWEAYITGYYGLYPHNCSSWGLGNTQSLAFYNDGNGTAYAVLPEFSNPLNQLQISFWMKTYSDVGTLQLGYLTADDNGTCSSFTTIVTYSNNNGNLIQQSTVLDNVPAEAERLAFKWSTPGMLYCYIDDLEVSINPNAIATQTVALSEGWNWWSTYLDITLDELKAALVSSGNTTITIKSKNQNIYYQNGRWRGNLNFDVAQMYKIYVNTSCEITLEGMPVNPSEHSITIHNGPNWIGFPLSESMTLSNAFAGFAVNGDVIKHKGGSANYLNGQWRGAFNLEPGQGYIYKSNAQGDRTLTFPTSAK